jgi:hypothetical protein
MTKLFFVSFTDGNVVKGELGLDDAAVDMLARLVLVVELDVMGG